MKDGKTVNLVSDFKFIIMCLSPIKLRSNASVIGSVYVQKLYNYIACGECSECQQKKSLEWLFRSYWQFQEVIHYGGYALFDTLTYSDENLPHVSDYLGDSEVDFPCFSLTHIQEFLNRFRVKLRRSASIPDGVELPIRYFLTSEYGTSEKGTHRPHYHIVVYCLCPLIKPLDLSYLISECWQFGRTDGAKYNGKRYVLEKRVIFAHSKNADSVHLHQYVAKYVEKDCEFSKTIKDRLYKYMYSLYENEVQKTYVGGDSSNWIEIDGLPFCQSPIYENEIEFLDWLKIPNNHSRFLKVKHLVCQFHKQSQGFGAYLLENIDLEYLWKTGAQKFRLADKNATIINVPLPIYYYRKLFQEQVYLADKLVWQYTEIGKRYADVRRFHQVEYLAYDIRNTFRTCNYQSICDFTKLAEYMIFRENAIGYVLGSSSVDDKLKFNHWFLVKRRGKYYVSEYYNSDDVEYIDFSLPYDDFIGLNAYHDDYYDILVAKYREFKALLSYGKQEAYELRQKRRKLFKKQFTLFSL